MDRWRLTTVRAASDAEECSADDQSPDTRVPPDWRQYCADPGDRGSAFNHSIARGQDHCISCPLYCATGGGSGWRIGAHGALGTDTILPLVPHYGALREESVRGRSLLYSRRSFSESPDSGGDGLLPLPH